MLDRDQLEAFATVAEERSFERAAAKLNLTKGAVSLRIKALEESLATVLLVRDKPVSPTPAGEVLLRHVKSLRLLEGATLRELRPQADAASPVPIAIAVNADSLATWFPQVLWPLLRDRQIALEVITDDQDHTATRLARGEVIGCVTTQAHPAAGFLSECLGVMEYRCCATPAFAGEFFPAGLQVNAVLKAPAVVFDRKDTLHDEFLKDRFGFSVTSYAKHYLPSPTALLEAVLARAGYALLPALQITSLIETGDLVELAPDHPVRVALHWHRWELEPPIASAISAQVVREGKARLLAAGLQET